MPSLPVLASRAPRLRWSQPVFAQNSVPGHDYGRRSSKRIYFGTIFYIFPFFQSFAYCM